MSNQCNVLCHGSSGPLRYPHSLSSFLLVAGTHPSLAPQMRRVGRQKCEVPENWYTGCGPLAGWWPGFSLFLHAPLVIPSCLPPRWAQGHRLRDVETESYRQGQRPVQVLRVYPSHQRQRAWIGRLGGGAPEGRQSQRCLPLFSLACRWGEETLPDGRTLKYWVSPGAAPIPFPARCSSWLHSHYPAY